MRGLLARKSDESVSRAPSLWSFPWMSYVLSSSSHSPVRIWSCQRQGQHHSKALFLPAAMLHRTRHACQPTYPYGNPKREILLVSSCLFGRWGSWDTHGVDNWPKATQLIRGRARIWIPQSSSGSYTPNYYILLLLNLPKPKSFLRKTLIITKYYPHNAYFRA